MTYAIIDLGTNTFNLLIAEINGKSFHKISGTKAVVKLGEGGITDNYIRKIPFQRGIKALLQHKKTIEKFKAEKIFAFATSAIREAKNGRNFLKLALEKTGIEINVISGEKEAELIYFGVNQAIELGGKRSLVMDIGGGSTEFIIANSKSIFWKQSFKLGVSRLLEKFKTSDPIQIREIKRIEKYFLKELHPLFRALKKFPSDILVGSSGSFDSFAEMIVKQLYNPKVLTGKTFYDFKLNDMDNLHMAIVKSNILERLKMKGLVPFRADNIVLSSILTQFIIKNAKIKKVMLSKYALKEGVLWAILNDKKLT